MKPVRIHGIGVAGGFGTGRQAFEKALESGLPPPSLRVDLAALEAFQPARTLRRMDSFSRLALLGAHLALEDAGLEPKGQDGLGLIIASGHGATVTTAHALLDSMLAGDAFTSPIHFANSMHNACAANISLLMGATGPNLTVSQFDLSVPSALLTAHRWLREGRVERLLFGAVDEHSDLLEHLWRRQRGESQDPMRPLATRVESARPGEGAAFFLLSTKEETAPVYAAFESVTVGRGAPVIPSSPLRVLGADGRVELGKTYGAMAEGARIACFTPHYGSFPASPAFDMAAAALMLRRGHAFASPQGEANDTESTVLAADEALGTQGLSCLTWVPEGFGVVDLAISA
ncbi:MAG: beta-ketoacyl synthase chain length factor [Firmicutes bacterium]|nr:beta-ketoacyl synthase chain length factor [Bacillota bacterium]